jgi:CheY-like chemotaxis protein
VTTAGENRTVSAIQAPTGRETEAPLVPWPRPGGAPGTPADPQLAGKRVLIIDDDIRNIFALTSALEGYEMKVVAAENGKRGLELLHSTPDIDFVLMDIMMPEMDGYETIRAIRQRREFQHLPIIAVTAKVMQGDREKCLEVGASDYVPKPVDIPQLLVRLRAAALN